MADVRDFASSAECVEEIIGGVEEGDAFGSSVSPGEDEGEEAGGFGGGEVDGGVADVGDLVGFEVPVADDLEGGGGVWLFGESFAMALDGGEEVGWKEGIHDCEGEGVWLVGEDGEGVAMGVEFFEEVHDAGVAGGAVFPVLLVMVLKAGHDLLAEGGILWAEGSFDEGGHAVADEATDFGFAIGGEPGIGEGVVEGEGDSGEGVDEGAIEIEDKCMDHSVGIRLFLGISEACFDRVRVMGQ